MATRLYFNTTTVPPVSPAFDASWEATGSAVRRMLEDAAITGKGLESFAPATILNTPAGAVDVLAVQYVSPQLASNVTISGAIRGQMQMLESAAVADLDVQTVIWVMKTDGTSRGTLIASDATGLSHEFNITTARNISIPKGGSTVPSSVAALATDRIVVELGYRKHENAVTSRTGTLRGGNELGTDLPVDETTTTILTPWIEFTETLTFTTSLRESETVAETLLATDPRLFESETVVQVLLAPPPDQLLTVPLLDAAATLYAPALTFPLLSLTVPLLDAVPDLYAPTVARTGDVQAVSLGLLDAVPDLYAPAVLRTESLTVPLLDGAPALYAPTVRHVQVLALGLLDSAPALYAPTLTAADKITVPLLDGAPALYAPILVYTKVITLGLLGAGPSLFAPTVVGGSFTQTLTLGLLTSTSALYSPTLIYSKDITLGLLGAGPFLYSPSVVGGSFTQALTLSLLGAPALYAPSIANTQIVSLPVLVSARVLQVPVLTITGGSRTVVLSLLDSERFLYPPTLTTGAVYVPGPGAAPPSIVIRVNGVDVTDIVRYSDALFVSQVNGTAGLCQFAVRDLGHDQAFVFGQPITLEIGGILRWSGYLQTINRQYSAAVVDTTEPTETARWFLLAGSDVNILFSRRVTHDPAHPTRLTALSPPVAYRDALHAEQWKEDTPSDAVVKYFISHYTDMVADGVSMGGVENLGSPNPDWAAAYAAAQTVGDFMRSVNTLLGGIWYLEPDKTLVHRAIETATTPKYLSDYVDGNSDRVGVRDYSFVSDASAMVNDAHVWGTAAGVDVIRHSHVDDEASIAAHGLWQSGEFNQSMYKQTSLDNRAEALVYGNDASRHGAKDDRILVQATVYEPVFFLGDVVTCYSHVYEDAAGQESPYEPADVLTAILPIRRIAYSFPTPTSVKYDLLLTQELDEPWSIYEYKFPKLKIPKGTGPGPIKWPKPPVLPPIEDPGGCSAEICGITDSFDRSNGPPGVSDAGLLWTTALSTGSIADISGNRLHLKSGDWAGSAYGSAVAQLPAAPTSGRLVYTPVAGLNGLPMARVAMTNSSLSFYNGPGAVDEITVTRGSASDTASLALVAGTSYNVEWDESATQSDWRVWVVNTSRPSSPTISVSGGSPGTATTVGVVIHVNTVNQHECYIENFDLDGVNRCEAVQFDDFNRTTTNGTVGVSNDGHFWNVSSNLSNLNCDGSSLFMFTGVATNRSAEISVDGAGPWSIGSDFTMTAKLQMNVSNNRDRTGLAFGLGSPAEFVSFQLAPRAAGGIRCSVNGATSDIVTLLSSYFGSDLMVKWEHTPATTQLSRVKVWFSGDPEPSLWTVSRSTSSDTYPGQADEFSIFFAGSTTGSGSESGFNTFIDYIEFDYDGKPCYVDCDPAVNWATDYGQWSWLIGNGEGASSSSAYGVVGNEFQFNVTPDAGAQDNVGIRLFYSDAPTFFDYLRLGTSFTLSGTFTLPDSPAGGAGTASTFWSVSIRFSGFKAIVASASIVRNAPTLTRVELAASGATTNTISGSGVVTPGTYPWSVSVTPTLITATIAGRALSVSPSPSFIVSDFNTLDIQLGEGAGTNNTDGGLYAQSAIDATASGNGPAPWCQDTPPAEGSSGIPLYGEVWETISHSGGNDFATARAFTGPIQIWVDGLIVTAFTSSPSLGEFHLTSSISASAVLRVRYQANGDPI